MRMIISVLLITVFVVPGHALAAEKSGYYRIIDQSYKSKSYGAGIAAMERAVREYPDEPNFFSNLMSFYCHEKRFNDALRVGDGAMRKFPDHGYTRDAYRWALIGLGWQKFEKKEIAASHGLFEKAFKMFPGDGDVINGYGCALREMKEYRKAAGVLEKGLEKFPSHAYIRQNLSWTYLGIADGLIKENRMDEARPFVNKFFELGDANDPNIHANYLYRCSHLRMYAGGRDKLAAAIVKFGLTDDIYKSGFWLIFNSAESRRTSGDFEGAVGELGEMCGFASKKEMPYEHGMTYQHFAVSAAHTGIYSMIETICPYWRKFAAGEKSRAEKLLETLSRTMPPEFAFIRHNLKGHILYRENRVAEAHVELEKAYAGAMALPFAAKFRYGEKVVVPAPLKGVYGAANCLSAKYITHMGLNRHCYDFFGVDAAGNGLKRRVDPAASRLEDWYGFGDAVYSPVGGTVIAAEGGNRDDPPFPKDQGRGNYVQVLGDDNRIYNFFHFMHGSLKVKKGDAVRPGQELAKLGNSSSTSPHLHFSVYSRDWIVTHPVYFTNYRRRSDGAVVPEGMPGAGKAEPEIIETRPGE